MKCWSGRAASLGAIAVLMMGGNALADDLTPAQAQAQAQAPLPQGEAKWGNFSLSSGINYSTGKYGQATSTDILYVPITGKLEVQDWTIKLTVPWVSVTGQGNVAPGVGAFRNQRFTERTTESGLGDLVLSVTKEVYNRPTSGTAVDVTGKIKFGTADADKGLGTGENDYSLAIEPSQKIGPVTAFGALGYKFVGNPDGGTLNNVVFGSLGGSMEVVPKVTTGLSLDVQSRTSDTEPGPQRELTAFASSKLADSWKGQVYLSKGLSDASPDWGGGAALTYQF